MKEEIFARPAAQDMDTNGYELSDLDDIEFYENPEVDLDAVFRHPIVTCLSPTFFIDLKMEERRSSEKPIVFDREEEKENSHPKTQIGEPPTETPRLPRSGRFWRKFENVLEYVCRIKFEKVLSVRVSKFVYKKTFH